MQERKGRWGRVDAEEARPEGPQESGAPSSGASGGPGSDAEVGEGTPGGSQGEGPADGGPASGGREPADAEPVSDFGQGQYIDQLQRLKAEFDNYRKRTLRDREQWWRQAKAELLASLLTILDDADRARAFAASGSGADADGLLRILVKLKETLTQLGLEAMETEPGTLFDPELHEAFMTAPSSDIEEGHIVSTLESGYRFEGEILRRSKVSVSSGSPPEDP